MLMTELEASEQLPDYLSDELFIDTVWVLIELVQHRVVNKLEHEIQLLLLAEYFYQID